MTRTDRASLLVHVDRATAFAALTDRVALEAWLSPEGMSGRFERFDMRAGGSYRLVLTYDDASDAPGKTTAAEDVSEVRIASLDPGRSIVQLVDFESDDPAFQGTMTMESTVVDDPHGAVVTIEARDVPPGVGAADHALGITSSLANLARYLEG
ncbi:SRPBCC domain-containing protein [Agrococcus jejuensis]|uniref:Uncharacterized conserved protein YndB, AHSA1/START domain n=1 Tax=Agrococcus jejuensis TaxID=399736 RepID=A0A1G8CF12_9MICO|nr:SRPBCC domain-containing protein [Agrococcus jejuensis]SDH43773.1 Uncharacterized conserved protein YndB, AHSA1/START domain [Agrococcus jejuensis]